MLQDKKEFDSYRRGGYSVHIGFLSNTAGSQGAYRHKIVQPCIKASEIFASLEYCASPETCASSEFSVIFIPDFLLRLSQSRLEKKGDNAVLLSSYVSKSGSLWALFSSAFEDIDENGHVKD